ncbi:hypothetical protein SLA2020_498670 [Shorea laevis]
MKTSSSPSFSRHCNREFSFSPLLLFLVFNTLIVVLIIGSYKSPVNEDGKGMPFSCFFYGVGSVYDDANTILEESYEEEGDVDGCASDGYYEDDDDNGSDDDDNDDWDDYTNEYDESLERRIEAFIAKVNEGWKEERLMEDRRKAQKVIGKGFSVSS